MHGEAVLTQPLQRVPVGVEGDAVGGADAVGPQRKGTVGGELGVELADRAGRRVAGVHEGGQTGLCPSLVERREVRQRHVDLAADLEQFWRVRIVEPKRDRGDRAQVVGDVLADLPVAAGGAALELPVAIDERDRQAVDLGFGDELELWIGDPLAGQEVPHALDPRRQVLARVRVGQRQHRLGVGDLLELGDWLGRDALGGRIGGDELGMLLLEGLQLVVERVVLVVADLRVIENVVAVGVVVDLPAELRGARGLVAATGLVLPGRAHGSSATFSAAGCTRRSRLYRSSTDMPSRSVRSKWTGVTAIFPCATAARSVPASLRPGLASP